MGLLVDRENCIGANSRSGIVQLMALREWYLHFPLSLVFDKQVPPLVPDTA